MKGKDVYDTTDGAIAAYQEDGAEGLVDFGVDEGIGMLVAGTAMKGAKVAGKGAKKALDAVEDMLPDVVTKAVGKAANSAGGVLKEASAVLDSAKGKAKTTVKSVFGLRGGGAAIKTTPKGRYYGEHGDLVEARIQDSHHIYQDAAVREIPGYSRRKAPAVQLYGPSTNIGSEHYLATITQRKEGGGTLLLERMRAYRSLRNAGVDVDESKYIVRQADKYFESLGVDLKTTTRVPMNRKVKKNG